MLSFVHRLLFKINQHVQPNLSLTLRRNNGYFDNETDPPPQGNAVIPFCATFQATNLLIFDYFSTVDLDSVVIFSLFTDPSSYLLPALTTVS